MVQGWRRSEPGPSDTQDGWFDRNAFDQAQADESIQVYAASSQHGEQEAGRKATLAEAHAVRGDDCIQWIEDHCCVPEGKFVGQPVVLREWQRDIIRQIYDTPTRRAIVSFGRKNAKTTLSAFLLLLHLCGYKARPNSQLFSTAQSRDQAAVLFALASKIVRMSPDLRGAVIIRENAKQLAFEELGTLYRALSAEAATAYGLSPVFVVHDELGQVKGPRSELYEAMETAAGAQAEPLSVIISTQAPTDADLLSVLIDDAKAGTEPKTKLFLYTADETLDPFSDEAINQANPAYGDFLNAEEVRDQAESARRMPSREQAYRNLVLNQRVNMFAPFVTRNSWAACAEEPLEEAFRGKVYGGLDLSSRNDLTALTLIAWHENQWHVRCEFWTPEQGLSDRARRDRAPYDLWEQMGLLHTTPGATVDFEFVAARLAQLSGEMDLRAIGFDRWNMQYLTPWLSKIEFPFTVVERIDGEKPLPEGLALVRHGQGFADMAPALDSAEAEILNKRIRHGGHQVLTWCAANAVAERNAAGGRKLEKAKSIGRIDGLVALVMAIRVALTYNEPDTYSSGRLVAL